MKVLVNIDKNLKDTCDRPDIDTRIAITQSMDITSFTGELATAIKNGKNVSDDILPSIEMDIDNLKFYEVTKFSLREKTAAEVRNDFKAIIRKYLGE